MIKEEPQPKMIKCAVARGRTVVVPTDKKVAAGWGPDTDAGEPVLIYRVLSRDCGPGEEIFLSEEDFKRLHASGFVDDLTNPNARTISIPGSWLGSRPTA